MNPKSKPIVHARALLIIDREIKYVRAKISNVTTQHRYCQKELKELGQELAPLLVSRAALVGDS